MVALILVARGAAIGAVGGAVSGYSHPVEAQKVSGVAGRLQKKGDSLAFYPGGRVDKEVDVEAYQNAPVAPRSERSQVEKQNALLNTLKGAGLAVTAGSVLAISHAGTTGGLIAAGVMGLTGAAIGHKVFSAHAQRSQPQHDFGQQWWNA